MFINNRPDTIFEPTVALELADRLNNNGEDDWRYEVLLTGDDKSVIQVRNEDGEVVGNL
tara:strand:+ start:15494 stop:15670 length:177 start_codon:yes stop_codon:yes gene_type:complete